MNPVLCRLTNKVLLPPSRGAVPFDRISSGPYIIVELRKSDYESIVIALEKWLSFQTRSEDGFEVPGRLFLHAHVSIVVPSIRRTSVLGFYIMFLDNFLKARIIQLCEFR